MENETLGKILDKLVSMEADMADIKREIRQVDAKVDRNYNHFLDYELQNATRHIELKEAIYNNKADVDYLKAIK